MGPWRLLASFAHPDDEAFTSSGILAQQTARGVDVRLLCATRGEAGDIRSPDIATRGTLGGIRHDELRASCQTLGLREPLVLGYRDSGWGDDPVQYHPEAFVQAPEHEVVGRIVKEMRRFRPQVVLTFEPGGLSGHKDHIAISRHTTTAYQRAGDPEAFPEHLRHGLQPYAPQRLFYTTRPQGYRIERALKLRQAGIDTPLPPPDMQQLGVPLDAIHLILDVSAHVDTKIASMRCHRSQISPEWERLYTSHPAVTELLGTEYFIRAHPPVPSGSVIASDLFAGLAA